MRKLVILSAIALFSVASTAPAFSAIKWKRFPHCDAGPVTMKTCECHRGTSGRFHYCHAGDTCDAAKGICHKK